MKRVRNHVNPLADLKEIHFGGFANNREIMVDVGSFRGEFVQELAEKFPDKNFLACEIRKPIAKRLEEKFANFKNVEVFDGDAGKNLKNLLFPSMEKGAKISRIFINFPDPWFKERHKKRRFINPKFLEEIKDWIPAQTEFMFQTDQKMLFEETRELLREKNIEPIFFDESPYGVRTNWEIAKMEAGDEIFRMRFCLE